MQPTLNTDIAAIARIEQSLGHINDRVKEIDRSVRAVELALETYNATLKVNTASLEYHIKRTDILESDVKTRERWLIGFLAALIVSCLGLIFKKFI